MNRKSLANQAFSLAVSAVILVAGVVGFRMLVYKPEQEASANPPPDPPLVSTVVVREHKGNLNIAVDGVVVPYREVEVASEVAGRVVFKNEACNGGRFVTKGTTLIRVDARDYELQVKRLTSQLEQAIANLQELEVERKNTLELIDLAQERLELDRKEVNRLADLSQDRVVTDSDLDKAKQAELAARNSLVQLENQLPLLDTRKQQLESGKALVETDLERAKLDVIRTEVVAPADGVVISDLVEEESYVQKGSPLFTLEDTSAVEVRCRLRMEELHWLWRQSREDVVANDYQIPQTPVTISYELTGRDAVRYEWKGTLSRYDGIGLDEATRTVPCRVVVSDPREVRVMRDGKDVEAVGAPPALVRGMFVGVSVHIGSPGTLVSIPEQAVQPGKAAWVVRNGRLSLVKPLTLVELIKLPQLDGTTENSWLVEAETRGLSIGDRVVVPPFGVLTRNMQVREGGSE